MRRACIALMLCLAGLARSAEPLILNIILNDVPRGDIDARTEADLYWLDAKALKELGIKAVTGTSRYFDGHRFVRLDQIDGVKSQLDLNLLQAALQADPELLPVQTSDFSTQSTITPWQGGRSAYLNYGLSAFRDANGDAGVGFSPLLNISAGGWNLRSRHDYQSISQGWSRLDSTLSYDRPDQMMRITLGDLSPQTGALGRGMPMGGIGISRVFSMQPGFETKPGLRGSAPVTSPSVAEIYVNGVVVKNMNLQPGMYQFQDLSYFSGFQDIAVVIKDQYGNREVYNLPYYFDDSLLKSGLHEFNYNLGLERQDGFDEYRGLAFSGLHRYGLNDHVTLGLRMERTGQRQSAGALMNLRLGDYGVLGGAASWADNGDTQGSAALLNYRYEKQAFNIRALLQQQSEYYLYSSAELPLPEWSGSVGFGFGRSNLGNWGFDITRQTGGQIAAETAYRLNFSASLARQLSVSASLSLRESGALGFLNLTWMPDNRQTVGAGLQHDELNQLRLNTYYAKNAPAGEGWGYRVNTEHGPQGRSADGFVQGRFASSQFTATARQSESGNNSYRLTAEGAVAFVEGHWGLSRPVTQSFALIQSEGLSGVGVKQNSQLIGRTDQNGYLWVPELGSYGHQQIELEQRDIPIEYELPQLRMDMMPGQNMGRLIAFAARRLQAYEAQLSDAAGQPYANAVLQLKSATTERTVVTSLAGALYLEDLAPGAYRLKGVSPPCSLDLTIPDQKGGLINLGALVCEDL